MPRTPGLVEPKSCEVRAVVRVWVVELRVVELLRRRDVDVEPQQVLARLGACPQVERVEGALPWMNELLARNPLRRPPMVDACAPRQLDLELLGRLRRVCPRGSG